MTGHWPRCLVTSWDSIEWYNRSSSYLVVKNVYYEGLMTVKEILPLIKSVKRYGSYMSHRPCVVCKFLINNLHKQFTLSFFSFSWNELSVASLRLYLFLTVFYFFPYLYPIDSLNLTYYGDHLMRAKMMVSCLEYCSAKRVCISVLYTNNSWQSVLFIVEYS